MKKIVLALAFSGLAAFAGTWTGVVSDSGCGAKHADGSEASVACVKRCAGRGSGLVFVVGDVVHAINDSDKGKLQEYLGKKATITGTLAEGKISVESVEAPK